ncbi:YbaB/EbfC family nucleoid-associated protein [Nocardia cyriacigeorgica]|uniref:YbaB/EbfC family nucleoid-associated protein n=1 Tax=Nocardia cyriacigeorgica TaxID=135487 RepID=UPI002455770C|nr:YbaB/EbfC family nucleoid-associated protein [Nocardia cyriacigeorgica]
MFESMDELEASVRRRLYRMRDLADDMASVRASETAPDGSMTAEVDGNGSLVNLQFTTAISELKPSEFEQRLVATAAAAARAAFARRAEIVVSFNEEVSG